MAYYYYLNYFIVMFTVMHRGVGLGGHVAAPGRFSHVQCVLQSAGRVHSSALGSVRNNSLKFPHLIVVDKTRKVQNSHTVFVTHHHHLRVRESPHMHTKNGLQSKSDGKTKYLGR